MAEVLRRVVGLLERAQHERAERAGARARCAARAARRAWRSRRAARRPAMADMRSGSGGVGTSARRAGRPGARRARVRALVHAIQARHASLGRAARRRPRWRRSSGARSGGGTRSATRARISRTLPCSSKANSGSSRVDDERAARSRSALQRGGGVRARRAAAAPHGSAADSLAGEDAIDPLVVQARVGADQRAVEGGAHDLRAVQLQLDGDGRGARRPGAASRRRSESAARQHRLDRAGHVDAGGAPARLAVDRRALGARGRRRRRCAPTRVVVAVSVLLGGDRVVEVARAEPGRS